MTTLGFIGLGTMGRGMAANLIAAGHQITVWNRSPQRTVGLEAAVAGSPREVGEHSEIVMICVSDTADVEEVVFGADGCLQGMAPGGIIVDHSTISPDATFEFAQRAAEVGVGWVDAPVSGGSEGAVRGSLAVMAGGAAADLERVRPYLDCYSVSVVHVGDRPGSGQMVKAINQVLVVVNALAVSEALTLAEAAGLDLSTTLRAVESGAAGSWMLSNRGPQVIAADWAPGFTIDLQQKDLRLVLEAAERLGVDLPGVSLTHNMYRKLQDQGLGAEGNHALIKAMWPLPTE